MRLQVSRFPLICGIAARAGLAVLAIGIGGVGLVTTDAAAEIEYEFILVEAFNPNYDLREVYMRDLNEEGTACGTSTYQSSYAGFVWTEATDKQLIPITWPRGLNNLNQVVGGAVVYDHDTGQSTYVPPVGWPLVRLLDINDNGIAVGFAECDCSNSDHVTQNDLIWDAETGSWTSGILSARELVRINNGNVAVGNIRPSAGSSEAFVYDIDTGQHTNLSDLLPDPPYFRPWSEGEDINESNVVVGQGYDGVNVKGMVWSELNGFTFLPALEGGDPTRVYPMALNNHGLVGGRALSGATGDWNAFLWDPVRGMRNLNNLVDAPGTFRLDWATKINDAGWIVGIGHFGPGWGTARGYVLKPVQAAGMEDLPTLRTGDLVAIPNPVGERTRLRFSTQRHGPVRLMALDAAGRRVATLLDRTMEAGDHEVVWAPGSSSDLPSGVYFLRLDHAAGVAWERLVKLR